MAPTVPIQTNDHDCGLYVCRYAYAIYSLYASGDWLTLSESESEIDESNIGKLVNKKIESYDAFKFLQSDIDRLRIEMKQLLAKLSVLYKKSPEKGSECAADKNLATTTTTITSEENIPPTNVCAADENLATTTTTDTSEENIKPTNVPLAYKNPPEKGSECSSDKNLATTSTGKGSEYSTECSTTTIQNPKPVIVNMNTWDSFTDEEKFRSQFPTDNFSKYVSIWEKISQGDVVYYNKIISSEWFDHKRISADILIKDLRKQAVEDYSTDESSMFIDGARPIGASDPNQLDPGFVKFIQALPYNVLFDVGFFLKNGVKVCLCPCNKKMEKWKSNFGIDSISEWTDADDCSNKSYSPKELMDHLRDKKTTLHKAVRDYLVQVYTNFYAEGIHHQALYEKTSERGFIRAMEEYSKEVNDNSSRSVAKTSRRPYHSRRDGYMEMRTDYREARSNSQPFTDSSKGYKEKVRYPQERDNDSKYQPRNSSRGRGRGRGHYERTNDRHDYGHERYPQEWDHDSKHQPRNSSRGRGHYERTNDRHEYGHERYPQEWDHHSKYQPRNSRGL